MAPRLLAIEGPKKGNTFPLSDVHTTIGRDAGSKILLADQSVSRRHCVIEHSAGEFVIRDAGSFNGIRVNKVPVKERSLHHGDHIVIGDSVFLFLDDDDEPSSGFHAVQLEEEKRVSKETVRLRTEDTLFAQPEKLLAHPPSERLSRDLNVLLKISTTIGSLRKIDNLVRELFEMIFEAVPAESGAILLVWRTWSRGPGKSSNGLWVGPYCRFRSSRAGQHDDRAPGSGGGRRDSEQRRVRGG